MELEPSSPGFLFEKNKELHYSYMELEHVLVNLVKSTYLLLHYSYMELEHVLADGSLQSIYITLFLYGIGAITNSKSFLNKIT